MNDPHGSAQVHVHEGITEKRTAFPLLETCHTVSSAKGYPLFSTLFFAEIRGMMRYPTIGSVVHAICRLRCNIYGVSFLGVITTYDKSRLFGCASHISQSLMDYGALLK